MKNAGGNLTAMLTLALAKCIKDTAAKAARDEVKPGAHAINAKVSVSGTLTVGEDTPSGPAVEVAQQFDPWVLIAVLQDIAGMDSKKVAQRAAKFKGSTAAVQEEYTAHAAAILPKISKPGSSARKGSVSFAGTVTPL